MKSLQYLSFFLTGVAALPASNVARDDSPLAALEPLGEAISDLEPIVDLPHIPLGERDDSPLAAFEPLGEAVSEVQPIVDLPHIPLGQRDQGNIAKRTTKVKKTAAELGAEIDLDKVIPLDAYKKFARDAEDLENIAPHPLPKELVDRIVKKGYLGKRENAGVAKRGTFNAEAQLVNVTGDHKWIAPDYANGAKRGPCIGMNSLANHGFINRNGIATVAESIIAVNDVYGMGIDIATFLTVYSLVLSGNPLSLDPSYSIGDESDEVQNLLGNVGGLLGTPQGLDGTHNTFEVDGSGTRGDLYDPVGNNHDTNISYFMDMYNLQKDAEEPNYDINVIIEHSLNRFKQAIGFNPYFYYGPFSGLVLRTGASFFAARLLVNCSEEHPEGILGKEALKSFFGVTGPEDNMTYTRGYERIPDNWYRRPDDYDVPGVALDLVNAAIKNPTILGIGGNVNGVNTYVGVDIFNISGSVVNSAGLLEGNNLLCFALQTLKLASPNSLSSLYTTLAKPLGMLFDVLDSSFASLACPVYGDLTVGGTDLFDYLGTFPGANKSGTFF